MTLVKWDPFETRFAPDYGVRLEGGDAVVTLELPGVDVEKDVDIEVTGRTLRIRGKRAAREQSTEGGRVVRSLRYGEFRRDFGLPAGVTAEQVTASYDQGLLEVRVRDVVPQPEQPQKIAISRSDGE